MFDVVTSEMLRSLKAHWNLELMLSRTYSQNVTHQIETNQLSQATCFYFQKLAADVNSMIFEHARFSQKQIK